MRPRLCACARIVVLALAVLAGIGCSQARADLALWYNGDFNGSDAFNNLVSTGGVTTSAGQALVYDDFVVPAGQTWTIDKVYSNDALGSNNSTTAYWEIRSGVSAGSGGSLLESGTDPSTQVATGRTFSTDPLNTYNEYTVSVANLNVTLAPGTYWLAVAPVGSSFFSGVTTTSGANSVDASPGGDTGSYISSSFYGYTFTPVSSLNNSPTAFSMGVSGSVSYASVPEPSVIACAIVGAVWGLVLVRKSVRRKISAVVRHR